MATPVSICSAALVKLGSRPISSFTEGSDTATMCASIYPDALDALLRMSLWNFAIKRVELAAETAAPAWGYGYAHVLPNDFIRLIEVNNELDYTVENGRILCDSTPLNITYVYRNENTASYDSTFVELLIQKMIAELAYPVTKSDSKAQSEFQKFALLARTARSIDAMEAPQPDFVDYPLINSRFRSY